MVYKLLLSLVISSISLYLASSQEAKGGLFEKKMMESICELRNLDYIPTEGYSTLDSYVESLSTKFGQGKLLLLVSFFEGVLFDLKEFLKEIVSSVITLSFSLVALINIDLPLIIAWLSLGCCKCFDCCLFNSHATYGKWGKCSLVSSVIFLTLILMSAIFSLISTSTLMSYFNGSSCYFLQFFYQSRYGDIEDGWIGLNSLVEVMNNTTELVNSISNNQIIFESHQELTDQIKKYDELIELSLKYSKALTDPSDSNKTFQTIYSKEYASTTTKQLYLAQIMDEYIENVQKTYKMMNSLYTARNKISKEKEGIQESIESLIENIDEVNMALDNISNTLINKGIRIQHQVSIWLMMIFRIIYGIFIGCSLISLISIPVYVFKHYEAIGVILHILWNILMLLSICGFIIGSVLGIASIIGVDIIPAISYTFSVSFLSSNGNPFLTKNTSAQYFSTCLNGNGDLASTLKLRSSNMKHLNSFYETSLKLIDSVEDERLIKESILLPEMLQKLKAVEKDYTKATDNTYGIKDVNYLLHDLSIYTDKGLERFNKDGIYCDRNDRWIGIVESCPDGYTYNLPSKEILNLVKEKNCFLVQDWTSDQVSQLYHDCSDNIKQIVNGKFVSLKSFNLEHTTRVRDMIGTTEKMMEVYKKMYLVNEKEFDRTKVITDQFYSVYYPIVKNETIFDLFDCGGLKDNFIIFFDQLSNYLTSACTTVGASCISCAFFGYISVFFLILVIYHYKPKVCDKNTVNELIKNEEMP